MCPPHPKPDLTRRQRCAWWMLPALPPRCRGTGRRRGPDTKHGKEGRPSVSDQPDEHGQDITDPVTGGSRLLRERCATCVFRPGNPMRLAPGRLRELLDESLPDGYIVCHDTVTHGPCPNYGPAICRGFFHAYATRSTKIRLMRAFALLVDVTPPERADEPVDS